MVTESPDISQAALNWSTTLKNLADTLNASESCIEEHVRDRVMLKVVHAIEYWALISKKLATEIEKAISHDISTNLTPPNLN